MADRTPFTTRALGYAAPLLAALGLLSLALYRYKSNLHSDHAKIFLEYHDMAVNGNYLLRGWNLQPNTYMFTDYPVYGLLGAVFGMGTDTVKAGAIAVLILSAAIMYALVRRAFGSMPAMVSAAALMVSAPSTAYQLIRPDIRVGTTCLALLGVLGVVSYLQAERPGRPALPLLLAALFTLGALGVYSDPYIVVIFAAPLPAAMLLAWLREGRTWPRPLLMAVVATALFASVAAGMYASRHSEEFGPAVSMIKADEDMNLTPAGIAANALHLPKDMLRFYGLPSESIAGTMFGIGRAALVMLAWANALLLLAGRRETARGASGLVLSYFIISSCLLLAALLVKGFTSPHYLVFLAYVDAVFIALLLVRPAFAHGKRSAYAVLALFLALSAYGVQHGFTVDRAEGGHARLADALIANGLTYGYAEYTAAHTTTMESGGAVSVRNVVFDPDGGYLLPHYYVTRNEWFHISGHEGRTFFVDSTGTPPERFAEMFGPFTETFGSGGLAVYVWPYNILWRGLGIDLAKAYTETGTLEGTGHGATLRADRGRPGLLMSAPVRLPAGRHALVFHLGAESGARGDLASVAAILTDGNTTFKPMASMRVQSAGGPTYRLEVTMPGGPYGPYGPGSALVCLFEVTSTGRAGLRLGPVHVDYFVR